MNHKKQGIATSPLISPSDLVEILYKPSTKIFDVRGTWSSPARALPEDYAISHIPNAAFLDWTTLFLEPDLPVNMAPVAGIESASLAFRASGINADDVVVLYDGYHHMLAGRIWWAMRYWGFNNVKVLDGGWHHWVAEGRAISTERIVTEPGSFVPKEREHLRVDMESFLQFKQTSCVLDARRLSGYIGSDNDDRSGHIPGAINMPYSQMLDPISGQFLPREHLEGLFDGTIPGWRDQRIISSCGAGYSGTVLMLALSHLGVTSSLFDDSFSVWKQDSSRPVERGEGSMN